MTDFKKTQAGMTIVEMSIVVLIFVAILGVLITLVLRHNTLYNYENALISANGSARTVMNEVTKYTLQAHRVMGSQVINSISYNSNATSLVLQVPAIDNNGNIILNTWDYVAIYSSANSVWEQLQAGPNSVRVSGLRLLSASLQSLTFTYNDTTNGFTLAKTVTIDLQTAQKFKSETASSHMTESIRLRNY